MLGVLPGILGSIQANEVIKVIARIGKPLSGRLFSFDAKNLETRTLNISKNKSNPLTGENPTQTTLIDYQEFCENRTKPGTKNSGVKEITVQELKKWIDSGKDFQLIDVREEHEYTISNLSGENIPLSELGKYIKKVSKQKDVVVHCKSGKRSNQAIQLLKRLSDFANLHNLKGGILAWADEIDHSLTKY